jgi:hypothetical protein
MRIQKKNFYDYSWKVNSNAVYVGRPSIWGNPFKVGKKQGEYSLEEALFLYRKWLSEIIKEHPDFLTPLKGKDLVCFCKLDSPCHADVIIEFLEGAQK